MLKTKQILYINLFTMILSFFGCMFFGYYLHNLLLIILWITIVLAVRCTVGVVVLNNQLSFSDGIIKEYILAMVIITIFEVGVFFLNDIHALITYFVVLLIYSIIEFNQLKSAWFNIKNIIN